VVNGVDVPFPKDGDLLGIHVQRPPGGGAPVQALEGAAGAAGAAGTASTSGAAAGAQGLHHVVANLQGEPPLEAGGGGSIGGRRRQAARVNVLGAALWAHAWR
jgi:hypothetical protein